MFISGANVVSCCVVTDVGGARLVFGVEPPWRLRGRVGGTLLRLPAARARNPVSRHRPFHPHSARAATQRGFTTINATIRVVNEGGLAYYSRMGFETHLLKTAIRRAQGRVFNRYTSATTSGVSRDPAPPDGGDLPGDLGGARRSPVRNTWTGTTTDRALCSTRQSHQQLCCKMPIG